MSFPTDQFNQAAEQIVQLAKELHVLGASPATSGNYSLRLNDECCAITVSGCDKSKLSTDDVMAIDFNGVALMDAKPSAEALLHTCVYKRFPEIGAVLHTHSLQSTLLTRILAGQDEVVLAAYELLKAFSSINTHDTQLHVPIFENTQDISRLANEVDAYLNAQSGELCYGYLIRNHGLYVWGDSLVDARRHLQAFEYLLECELKMLSSLVK